MTAIDTFDGFGFWGNALLGAVVTIVLSFVPFSPVLGGGVAGFLQGTDRRAGLRVGAVSGAVASIPILLVLLAIAAFVPVGVAVGDVGLGLPILAILILLTMFVLTIVYGAGLGALGGYVGAVGAERRVRERPPEPPEDDDQITI
jgi:hypothetical protein